MLTNKDYCDYDTSVALYALGYDCQVIHLIAEKITLYEAQKWLREEKEFYVFVGREWENAYYYWLSKKVEDKTVGITHSFYYPNGEGQFSSYEEALSEGIKEAVKILISESEVDKLKSNNTSIKFTSILRLMEIIPSNVWNQDNRGRVYSEKLANILEREGYSTDAKLIREKIKQMDGENVPLAIMD